MRTVQGVPDQVYTDFEEAAELRGRAMRLTVKADCLIRQAEQLSVKAAALSDRAKWQRKTRN